MPVDASQAHTPYATALEKRGWRGPWGQRGMEALAPPTVTVVAVVPAHNEADRIAMAIRGIRSQVDRVIVVDDRSTDGTAAAAREAGAEVFAVGANEHKKAGALNRPCAGSSRN